jgi:hypothetical protein
MTPRAMCDCGCLQDATRSPHRSCVTGHHFSGAAKAKNLRALEVAEKLSAALFCNRARLQACRKCSKRNAGFSPCYASALIAACLPFFRSLFSS